MELVVEQGQLQGQVFRPQRTTITIGRGADNDLVLPDHGVSRRHARLQRGAEGWILTDLGSTNGTYVNGEQILGELLLQPGDRVALGSSTLLVQQAALAEPAATGSPPQTRSRRGAHPALLAMGALALIVLVVGLVLLLVTLLQPPGEPPMPTQVNQIERVLTQLPVPTEVQGILATVVPAIPTHLDLPLLGPPTPTPEANVPTRGPTQAGSLPQAGDPAQPRPFRPPPPPAKALGRDGHDLSVVHARNG